MGESGWREHVSSGSFVGSLPPTVVLGGQIPRLICSLRAYLSRLNARYFVKSGHLITEFCRIILLVFAFAQINKLPVYLRYKLTKARIKR